jgi:uncharacterized protein
MRTARERTYPPIAYVMFAASLCSCLAISQDTSPSSNNSVVLSDLVKRAQQGDPEAQFVLGRKYADGDGVQRDYTETRKWCQKAARKDHAGALACLGFLRLYGLGGIQKDVGFAYKDIKRAADKGHRGGEYYLGLLYEEGLGIEKNAGEAVQWYRRAAHQGHGAAQYRLAVHLWTGKGTEPNAAEAVRLLQLSAAQKNADAALYLGKIKQNGLKSVEKSEPEAVDLFRIAADRGNAEAMHELSDMLCYSKGVQKNTTEGLRWIIKAAETSGSALYQYYVGQRYAEGFCDTSIDHDKAVYWLTLSSKQSYHAASEILGKIAYKRGAYDEAVDWYTLSGNQGTEFFQRDGWFHAAHLLSGHDTNAKKAQWESKNKDRNNEAIRLYRLSAAEGKAEAQYELGLMLYGEESLTWTTLAAEQGVYRAQMTLCAQYGVGKRLDIRLGHLWCRVAARNEKCNEKGRQIFNEHADTLLSRMQVDERSKAEDSARDWKKKGWHELKGRSPLPRASVPQK